MDLDSNIVKRDSYKRGDSLYRNTYSNLYVYNT